MAAKQLVFHEAAREEIRRCVDAPAEIGKDDTTLIGGAGKASAVAGRVATLRKARQARQAASGDCEREQFDGRIARLSGGVALIKGGAATESELKERKVRVEGALHATRAALDEESGIRIVAHTLEEPLRRIVGNAGVEPSVVVDRIDAADDSGYGYIAATRSHGHLLQMGVVDPVKVTRLALQNASSMASLILSTDCLIATAPKPRHRRGADEDAPELPAF